MARSGGKWSVVATMAVPLFLIAADINGVTVALPAIGDDLDASTGGLQWVLNAYLLAFAAFQIPAGRFGDIFGRRRILLGGLIIFGLASFIPVVAQSQEVLIAGRALQGVGAAMLFATSLSLVSGAFPPDERAKGIGVWTALGVSGAAIGPLLGGVLTDTLSWRWFFFINVPISLIAIVMTLRYVPESRDESASRRVDYTGFATVTLGLLALVFAIQQVDTSAVASATVAVPAAIGVVLLAVFIAVELRRPEPLIDLRLFRGIDFVSTCSVGAISQWLFFSTSFLATLYLQNILDMSALQTGLIFLALAVPFVTASIANDTLMRLLGIKWGMNVGTAMTGIGALLLAFAGTGTVEGVAVVTVAYILLGLGLALAVNISTTGGMIAIPDAKAGAASGVLSSSRFVAAAFGVAVVGAVFKTTENDDLAGAVSAAGAPSSETGEVEGLLSGSQSAIDSLSALAPSIEGTVEQATGDAFVRGLAVGMVLNVIVAAVGIALGLTYKTPEKAPGGGRETVTAA
jgi:EmrB/QacA subfamily drug resistance transporter